MKKLIGLIYNSLEQMGGRDFDSLKSVSLKISVLIIFLPIVALISVVYMILISNKIVNHHSMVIISLSALLFVCLYIFLKTKYIPSLKKIGIEFTEQHKFGKHKMIFLFFSVWLLSILVFVFCLNFARNIFY
jgi:hypothetical protein